MSFSRIIAILAAVGAALSAVVVLVTDINPKYAAYISIAGVFISIFCERVQGGLSRYDIDEDRD